MQPSDFSRILKTWYWLIGMGAGLGLVIGLGMAYKGKIAPAPTQYGGSEAITLNCIVPGCQYLAGVSPTTVATELAQHIHDPGILQVNPNIPGPKVSSISANVNGNTDQVVVKVTASTVGAVQAARQRAGRYLTHLEDQNVSGEARGEIKFWQKRARYAEGRWIHFKVIGRSLPPTAPISVSAPIQAKASFWQGAFETDQHNIQTIKYPGVPAATISSVSAVKPVSEKSGSMVKTVFPAAIIGLMLSFLLAAYLDNRDRQTYALTVPPVEAAPPKAQIAPDRTGRLAPPREPAMGLSEPFATGAAMALSAEPSAGSSPAGHGSMDKMEKLYLLAEPMNQTAEMVSDLLSSSQPSLYVTSPTSDEPAAATSIGLASALALRGRNVVLVDANPAGTVTTFFGLNGRPGVADFLAYPRGSLPRLTYATQLMAGDGRLSVLPRGINRTETTGLAPANEVDLVSVWSQGLADLVRTADLVLVNGPSVLDSAEDGEAASAAGGVILALREERNDQDVGNACDILQERGARVLGVVVNPSGISLNGHDGPTHDVSSLEPVSASAAGAGSLI